MDWLHGVLALSVACWMVLAWHRGQVIQQLRGDVLRALRQADEYEKRRLALHRERWEDRA